MPVDTATEDEHMTPLHAACLSKKPDHEILPLVQYFVDSKGASRITTFGIKYRETAADICKRTGKQTIFDFLRQKEKQEALRQEVVPIDEIRLAEQVQAAEAAAQELVNELAAEEAAGETRKQAKKDKKKRAKSKRAGLTAAGKGEPGSNGDEGFAAATGAGLLSMESLTAAMGRSVTGVDEKEDEAEESKTEESSLLDGKLPALALSVASAHDGEDENEEEEDDEEAFQDFLLDKAPLEYHCPIGICLLTDPINAADGHTYQRADLENWIEMCRVEQQPLTSPMTKEEMAPMYFVNQFVKSHVGQFIEQQRHEWVARKGQKKEGGKVKIMKSGGPAR